MITSLLYSAIVFIALFNENLASPLGAGEIVLKSENGEPMTIYVSGSSSEQAIDDLDVNDLELYIPPQDELLGCAPLTAAATKSETFAILLERGDCTFQKKVEEGQNVGASLVLVANELNALYNTTSGYLKNACELDCTIGEFDSIDDCESNSACYSNLCATNPLSTPSKPQKYCCLADELMPMYLNDTESINVPALFVSMKNSVKLQMLYSSNETITLSVSDRDTMLIDPSVVVIGLIGIFATIFATFRATAKERESARWVWTVGKLIPMDESTEEESAEEPTAATGDAALETVDLSMSGVVGFLVMASVVLVGLFYLTLAYPHQAVIAINVMFAIGSIASVSYIFLQPLFKVIFPCLKEFKYESKCLGETVNGVEIASTVIAAVLSTTWFIFRHANFAWILLDIACFAVSSFFLLTIKLPSLKIATALMMMFFIYDVFMVFISPLIFNGQSVMVQVATAGAATQETEGTECVRRMQERMPMLFMVPRFDWPGGFSLLGLGDILIPGLLITLALRFDYTKCTRKEGKRSCLGVHAYYIPIILSYAAGLVVTFVANISGWTINNVKGQPALLYLVPFTLGTFSFLAYCRGDYGELWSGRWSKTGKEEAQV